MAGGSTQKGLIKAEAPHAAAKLAKGEQMTGTPEWDDVKAASLVGKVVLICITRRTSDGPAYEQMFGRIISGNRSDGFEVALDGSRAGARYSLPPQTDTFVAAQAGEYRLRLTGETVVNPDFLATWIVDPPEDWDGASAGDNRRPLRGPPDECMPIARLPIVPPNPP